MLIRFYDAFDSVTLTLQRVYAAALLPDADIYAIVIELLIFAAATCRCQPLFR